MDYVKVFLMGGIICALIQILMDKTKLLPGRVMVLLVCSGVVLGALGLYKPLIDFGQGGATVPLSGFGYMLWQGVKEAIDKEGFIGVFKGGFVSSSVGISASLLFGYIAQLFFKSKMKK